MRAMQNDMYDRGQLQVNVTTINNIPIENVNISIYEEGQPTNKIEEITTDASGQSEKIDLATPPVELS